MRAMYVALAITALSVLNVSAASAKIEKQVTRTIWELKDFPALAEAAGEICDSKFGLSDKLKSACETKQFGRVTKAGAFYNVGIGAELNTLIRQKAAKASAPATDSK